MNTEKKNFAVMLIDDNAIDNMIHAKVINKSDIAEVIYNHHSGSSAIEFLKNIAKIPTDEGKTILPSYVFLDLDMPLMDGFQFMAELDRLDQEIIKDIKIVLLTASVNESDKEYPKRFTNFYKYINKPLSVQKIAEL
jgi:CheY-like chemotaxis protein